MSSTYGRAFRITTWGESHGGGVGVVLDGCPPGLAISEEDIQIELDRRKPGQSKITTQRKEEDQIEIHSGLFEGKTLGTPISMMVWNQDARSRDYEEIRTKYRPSHADYTYEQKYGIRNWKGGGRASARETIGRVAAGAVARKLLKRDCDIDIIAYVRQVHTLVASVDPVSGYPRAGRVEYRPRARFRDCRANHSTHRCCPQRWRFPRWRGRGRCPSRSARLGRTCL